MTEIGYPLRYLFAIPNGAIRRWAMNYVTKAKKHLGYLSSTTNNDDVFEEALARIHPDDAALDPDKILNDRTTSN